MIVSLKPGYQKRESFKNNNRNCSKHIPTVLRLQRTPPDHSYALLLISEVFSLSQSYWVTFKLFYANIDIAFKPVVRFTRKILFFGKYFLSFIYQLFESLFCFYISTFFKNAGCVFKEDYLNNVMSIYFILSLGWISTRYVRGIYERKSCST